MSKRKSYVLLSTVIFPEDVAEQTRCQRAAKGEHVRLPSEYGDHLVAEKLASPAEQSSRATGSERVASKSGGKPVTTAGTIASNDEGATEPTSPGAPHDDDETPGDPES